jgi:hypothetical protein
VGLSSRRTTPTDACERCRCAGRPCVRVRRGVAAGPPGASHRMGDGARARRGRAGGQPWERARAALGRGVSRRGLGPCLRRGARPPVSDRDREAGVTGTVREMQATRLRTRGDGTRARRARSRRGPSRSRARAVDGSGAPRRTPGPTPPRGPGVGAGPGRRCPGRRPGHAGHPRPRGTGRATGARIARTRPGSGRATVRGLRRARSPMRAVAVARSRGRRVPRDEPGPGPRLRRHAVARSRGRRVPRARAFGDLARTSASEPDREVGAPAGRRGGPGVRGARAGHRREGVFEHAVRRRGDGQPGAR